MGKRRVYYGWYIVAACVIVVAASLGFHNTAGIFIRPVTEDLGLSRGEFTFFRTIVFIISAATMPLYGKIAVRFSIKKVMLIGTTINGLTLAAYSIGTQIWHFYLIAVIGGLVVNSGNFMICGILISRWFDDKQGLALGISFAGSGLGAAIMNPAASWIIEVFDWRVGFIFSGAAALAVSIPAILILIKDTPESIGLEPYKVIGSGKTTTQGNSSSELEGLTLQQARKTPIFWLLAIALLGISISAAAPNFHTPPYLSDLGYDPRMISAVIALCMVFLTVGKIIMGHVFDRLGTFVGGIALGMFCILSPVFALYAIHPEAVWLHAIFLGLAATGISLAANIYAIEFFGKRDFPAIFSTLSVIVAVGGALSPPVMGFSYDLLGSYTIAWIVLVVTGITVTLCLVGANIISSHIKKRRNLLCSMQN